MSKMAGTVWDDSHPWINNDDRLAWERSLASDDYQQRLMANAILNSDPTIPDKVLRRAGQRVDVPARYGYINTEIGITEVLTGNRNNRAVATRPALNDFSGSPAGYEGSSRNTWNGLV